MRFAVAVLIAGLFASSAARAARPSMLETAGLAAAETSLVLDAIQTFNIKNHAAFVEQNPILGSAPSDAAVLGYFVGTMAVTAVAWYLLPSKIRNVVPVVVLALEVPQVARNSALIALDQRSHPNQNRVTRGMSIKVRF